MAPSAITFSILVRLYKKAGYLEDDALRTVVELYKMNGVSLQDFQKGGRNGGGMNSGGDHHFERGLKEYQYHGGPARRIGDQFSSDKEDWNYGSYNPGPAHSGIISKGGRDKYGGEGRTQTGGGGHGHHRESHNSGGGHQGGGGGHHHGGQQHGGGGNHGSNNAPLNIGGQMSGGGAAIHHNNNGGNNGNSQNGGGASAGTLSQHLGAGGHVGGNGGGGQPQHSSSLQRGASNNNNGGGHGGPEFRCSSKNGFSLQQELVVGTTSTLGGYTAQEWANWNAAQQQAANAGSSWGAGHHQPEELVQNGQPQPEVEPQHQLGGSQQVSVAGCDLGGGELQHQQLQSYPSTNGNELPPMENLGSCSAAGEGRTNLLAELSGENYLCGGSLTSGAAAGAGGGTTLVGGSIEQQMELANALNSYNHDPMMFSNGGHQIVDPSSFLGLGSSGSGAGLLPLPQLGAGGSLPQTGEQLPPTGWVPQFFTGEQLQQLGMYGSTNLGLPVGHQLGGGTPASSAGLDGGALPIFAGNHVGGSGAGLSTDSFTGGTAGLMGGSAGSSATAEQGGGLSAAGMAAYYVGDTGPVLIIM